MCAKVGKLSAGQSAGIGFGLDAVGALAGYSQKKRDVARQNDAIRRQNQLAINAYNTKNRNAKLAWENDKIDGDIAVDNKWRETKDAIAEAQLQARETMGKSAIAQQQILTKMINAGAGREQAGRRSGRGGIAEKGAQWAAQGAAAAFSRDSAILFQDKAGRNLASFAQGKYVEYITGRPSPEAPPILESYRKGPSFLSTALQIGQAGLSRYNQYKGNTNKPGWNNVLQSPNQDQNQGSGTGLQNMPWTPSEDSPSISGQLTTMEVPSYSAPVFGGDKSVLQGEMDDYFAQKAPTNSAATLGSSFQQTFV
ncbi:MAG: hypothetical protein CMA49_00060 [Euryarchaeota archaeon]|nr:hypothetical protein [Euryarchaeota archaeon]|tara:strand:+ start:36 stop:965 length:930 start_codon:yes stop_codon:yes gene_type:complete